MKRRAWLALVLLVVAVGLAAYARRRARHRAEDALRETKREARNRYTAEARSTKDPREATYLALRALTLDYDVGEPWLVRGDLSRAVWATSEAAELVRVLPSSREAPHPRFTTTGGIEMVEATRPPPPLTANGTPHVLAPQEQREALFAGKDIVIVATDDPTSRFTLRGHTDEVTAVSWSETSHFLATTGKDRRLLFHDLYHRKLYVALDLDAALTDLELSRDAERILTRDTEGVVRLYDVSFQSTVVLACRIVASHPLRDEVRRICP